MKLFEPDLKSTSYKIPIIKLVTSVLIITACMFRGSIFHVENKLLIFIFSFVAVALVISCILVVYISCCEIFATFENTHESVIAKGKQRWTRGYKQYKETSGLIEWKECQIFHSIFT